MKEAEGRKELVRVCRMLYDRKLTFSAGGNVSVRLDDGTFLITPSGRNKGLLSEKDMVRIDPAGESLDGGKPSIERFFHLALYGSEPGTNAVIHCHPLNCTALAVMGKKVNSRLTPEGIMLLGDVPLVEYRTPGSEELVDAVRRHHRSRAMTMARHGAITQGGSLAEAYDRMEELEFQASLQILAGGVGDMPENEIRKILGGNP